MNKNIQALKKYWPWSFTMQKGNVSKLVWTVVVYVLVGIGVGIVTGLLGFIPGIGWILNLVGYFANLYLAAGVVFAFLNYFGIGPFKN